MENCFNISIKKKFFQGQPGVSIKGEPGLKGQKGETSPGVSIIILSFSMNFFLHSKVLIEFSFQLKGEKGADGRDGRDGKDGKPGPPGLPGYTGEYYQHHTVFFFCF